MYYIKRTLSYTLVGLLTFQPAIVSAGVVVDANAAKANQALLEKAGNGIDIVNIARPSAKGVSHNKFSELDITPQGLIFNNANVITATDLAGYIEGNPQLTAGSASIILNEVTSANRSLLEGYAEIAGQAADFILANPNGITCNGCGFINTPRATLTTGSPNFLDGDLHSFSINGGDIELGGLNSSNIDRLDILTRALVLNDELHANALNIVTGRNDVSYSSLSVTELADDGSSKPAFSLDTAALGGMYANSITLIGTEEGVGVNVEGELSAGVGNIELSVNGDIVFTNKVQAAQSITLNTTQDVTVGDNLLAEDGSIQVVADYLENNAAINAEEGLGITADTAINNDAISANNITLTINESLANNGTVIAENSAVVSAASARIVNGNGSELAASQLTITANELTNSGNIQGDSHLDVSVTRNITNRAIIQTDAEDASIVAGGEIDNSCDDTDTYCGNIAHAGQGQLTLSAQSINNEGADIASNGQLTITADHLSNQKGDINALLIDGNILDINNNSGALTAETLSLSTQTLTNNHNGTLTGNSQLRLNAAVELQNNNGGRIQTNANNATLYSGGQLTNRGGSIIHSGTGELQLSANTLDGTDGEILSNGVARVIASEFDNTGGSLQADTVTIDSTNVTNDGGSFIADIVSITADWISSIDGLIRGADELSITATQNLNNTQGVIQTNQSDVVISVGNIFTNSQGEITHAGSGTLSLQSALLDNQQGTIESNGAITVVTTSLDNRSGSINADSVTANNLSLDNDNGIISADNLSLGATDISNVNGELTGVNALTISSVADLDNTDGVMRTNALQATISAGGALNNTRGNITHAGLGKLDLDVAVLTNSQGIVASNGEIDLTASRLDNSEGAINADGVVVVATDVINRDGDIVADTVGIKATTLNNINGKLTGVDNLSLTISDTLDNTNGLIQTNDNDVAITAGNRLTNTAGTITHAGTGTLSITSAAISNSGTIASNGSIDVDTSALNNTNGALEASTAISVANSAGAAPIVNDGGTIIGDMVLLATQWLSNVGGTIAGLTGLNISSESDVVNDNGVVQTAQANFSLTTPGNLSNQNGQILHFGNGELNLDVTGILNNTGGLLQSQGDMTLRASRAINDNGLWVTPGNISLTSAGLSNVGGGIYGVGATSDVAINIGNYVLNTTNGVITGADQVSVIANTITNTGGTIWSDNELTLDLYSAASGGVIGGYKQLNLITDIDYQNAVGTQLLTTGGLDITTLGTFINEGEISVQDNFNLTAKGLTNTSSGIIASAQDMFLDITGNVSNQGRISAARNLTITAFDIANIGTLGAGNDLGITANSISNGNNSLLFSGNHMSLALVQNLTNDYGTLFANNSIDITSSAGQVENISGTINAYDGNLFIAANAIINRKSQFSVSSSLTSNSGVNYWCTDCSGDNYTWYWEAYSYYTDVISLNSPMANLLSGADMTLVGGSITNEYSAIAATGDLTMTGDSLTNIGYAGGEKTVYERWKARTTDGTYWRRVIDTLHPAGLIERYTYIDDDLDDPYNYTTYRPFPNWDELRLTSNPIPSSMRNYNRTHYTENYTAGSQATGTIQAGGSITGSFTGQIDNVNIAEYTTTPSNIGVETLDSSTTQGQRANINSINFQNGDAQLTSVGSVNQSNSVQSVNAESSTITAVTDNDDVDRVNENTAIAITDLLPQRGTGVFTIHPEADHPYLVESDPLFADYGNFISSDYLLGRLGIDTDGITKRLGDAYYETQLVRQAAYNATGQVAHIGFGSELNWMQSLMDNAVAQSTLLDLSFGISLSDEQVAALTQDMIWMVEREVEGQIVLVPELYLASVNENSIARGGAVITGDSVQLMTAAGDINNSGALSSKDLFLQSGKGLNNRGALISNNALQVESRTDIANIGGSIRGENVGLVSREGSIENKTKVTQTEWGKTWRGEAGHITTQVGHRASITAENNLSLDANKSINIAAAQVTSGGNAELNAGEGITITAEQTRDRHAYSWRNGHMMEDTISHEISEIKVANNLTLNAGKDIEISGSQVNAGNDVSIRTQRDFTVSSVQDEHHYEFSEKDNGSFGRSSEVLIRKDSITQQGSLIKAGGDLMINTAKTDAGIAANDSRDVTITASKAEAGKDLVAYAGRNLTVDGAENATFDMRVEEKSGFGGLSGKLDEVGDFSITQVGSSLLAANDALLLSGKDTKIVTSHVEAANDVVLTAGVEESGSVIVQGGLNEKGHTERHERKKLKLSVSNDMLSFSETREQREWDTRGSNAASVISAGNDVVATSTDKVVVVGSQLAANSNVIVHGNNGVELSAGLEYADQGSESSVKRSGIGLTADGNALDIFIGSEKQTERDTLKGEYTAASNLAAGGDIQVTSGKDINVTSSDLLANQDIHLQAEGDVKLLAAQETVTKEQVESVERNGLTVSINYNVENTLDAIKGTGEGDNSTSKVSSVLKTVDAIDQFASGPTASGHIGRTTSTEKQIDVQASARNTTLSAGRDISIVAEDVALIKGADVLAARDIQLAANDVIVSAADNRQLNDTSQTYHQTGINVDAGKSSASITGGYTLIQDNANSGTHYSTNSTLAAGKLLALDADRDLNVEGSRLEGENIDLAAGRDINIVAVENAYQSEESSTRDSAHAGVKVTVGSEGIAVGFNAKLGYGRGELERQGGRYTQSDITATDKLTVRSGNDTHVEGANLDANDVAMDIGGDLTVASARDHGEVDGKRVDLDLDVTVGYGFSISGSAGYGESDGSTDWVQQQTTITGRDSVVIRTEDNTHIEGALIAANDGDLVLDTGSLTYNDIQGHDKETHSYTKVSGSYGDMGNEQADENGNSWGIEGSHYNKDREQIARATVGEGDIIIRDNPNQDISDLNRDVEKAYEITKDEEETTELYVTSSSLRRVGEAYDSVLDELGVPSNCESCEYEMEDLGAVSEDPEGFLDAEYPDETDKIINEETSSKYAYEDAAGSIDEDKSEVTSEEFFGEGYRNVHNTARTPEDQLLLDTVDGVAIVSAGGLIGGAGIGLELAIDAIYGDEISGLNDAAIEIISRTIDVDPSTVEVVVVGGQVVLTGKAIADTVKNSPELIDDIREVFRGKAGSGPDESLRGNGQGNNGSFESEADFGSLNQPSRGDTLAEHENLKTDFRRQMERPNTSGKDPQLEKVLDENYRPNAKIGSGSTADALRHEILTGEKVGGREHRQKAENTAEFLRDWLRKNENNKNVLDVDKAAVQNVLKDLDDALRTQPK